MVSLGAISYFIPIFAFLLVFIIIYALLKKTKVLGEGEAIMLFISLILASFFVLEASLVDWVRINSAWIGVVVVAMFFIVLLIAFVPGVEVGKFFGKSDWLAWSILGVIVALFIISSAYVFNWAINWETAESWVGTEWFGLVLLVIIGAIVSWRIKK